MVSNAPTLAVFITAWIAIQGCSFEAKWQVPQGVVITSKSKTHVHAKISDLRLEDYPALASIHALHTVYFSRNSATDSKLKALCQLRFTNLVGVVLTDCNHVTDKGIEHLSAIPTLHSLGLRQMLITDAACETLVNKMHLREINMPNCTNVSVNGLLKLVHSPVLESIGFSAGHLSQEDVVRLISTAGPKLYRMDIYVMESSDKLLDFSPLRQAAEMKRIQLFAVHNMRVGTL